MVINLVKKFHLNFLLLITLAAKSNSHLAHAYKKLESQHFLQPIIENKLSITKYGINAR